MGNVIQDSSNALKVATNVLEDGPAYNLNRLGDPSARKIDSSTKTSSLGLNGGLKIESVLTRSTDPMQEAAQRTQISRHGKNHAITEYLREMQTVIGGGDNSQKSPLVEAAGEFFAQAKLLEANSDLAMKETLLVKAEGLAQRISDISAKGTSLQLRADNQMKESIADVNATIENLFTLNHELGSSQNPITMHDLRDQLVNHLAEFMDIKVTYQASGSVMVQSKKDGTLLVDGNYYAKFEYPGIMTEDVLLDGYNLPPMTMIHYDETHKPARQAVVFMGGSDDSTQKFSGGSWDALVELRQEKLPELIRAAKYVGRNITKTINNIHNDGSTFPPKTRFESSMVVQANESYNWEPFTIYSINQNGDQLRGGAGLLNPITIDMNKISSNMSGSSSANVADLIKEINHAIDTGPSRQRAAIGAIKGGNGLQIQGEYLVNNMQIKANSGVYGEHNSFTFELDIQGNSHFGSSVQIMNITTDSGYQVSKENLPGDVRIEKSESSARSMSTTVENINGPSKIIVEVRVVGDNGEIQRGSIEYDVDPSVLKNDRISVDSMTANQNGDFQDPAVIQNFTSVGHAMLVDENGIEINLAKNPYASGKLVIETSDNAHRLAFSGSLGRIFEFNDFFEFDERTGKMSLNEHVALNVGNIAVGQPAKDSGLDVVHTIGDSKASATLVFGGAGLNDGSTVTVGGQVFTFVALPANENQVSTAGGVAALKDAINSHSDIGKLVSATLDGNILTLQAKNAGTGGNGINVETNLIGGATVDLNNAGANAINNGSSLINGTNKTLTSKIYSYIIKPESGEVIEAWSNLQFGTVRVEGNEVIPHANISLSDMCSVFTGVVSSKLNAAKVESSVSQNVLADTVKNLQNKFGIKNDEQYIKLIDAGRVMQALSRVISMINNMTVKSQDIMFGG